MLAAGNRPGVVEVSRFQTRLEAEVAEVWHTKMLRALGAILTNGSDGGEGGGVNPTDETRRRIGAASKGRKWSSEAREKQSQRLRGRVVSEEQRKGMCKIPDEKQREVVRLYEQGFGKHAIAARLGLNASNLKSILKRFGVNMRSHAEGLTLSLTRPERLDSLRSAARMARVKRMGKDRMEVSVKELITTLLSATPRPSDRSIARRVGVSYTTVRRVRLAL